MRGSVSETADALHGADRVDRRRIEVAPVEDLEHTRRDILLDRRTYSDQNYGQIFTIELSRSAAVDLVALRAFDRARVVAEIRAELAMDPTTPARNKKMLRELRPAWEHVPPLWQLRVGDFRVFYDVNDAQRVVHVRRVIRKGSKTTGEVV